MIKVRIKKVPKARTGYQVQGALVNDVPAMGGADNNAYIGAPKLRESKYISAVPREEANLEAEGGETVYGDINGDGMPEHKIIKGPRHAQGGVPLKLPEDTFIFSDTRAMRIKDPEILTMFGKGGVNKSYTPAELAKQYDVQKYRKILEDPETDAIERKTAELMIKKFVVKLGCLALAQESMKGFPQGIPAVAKPCMEARGLTEDDVMPNKEIKGLNDQLKTQMKQQQGEGSEGEMEQAVDMNEGNPVAQPEQQMQPQEQMQQPSPEEMMRYGGMKRLRRAQEGMQQPSQEEMAMMQQQGQPQEQGGGDQMGQVIQEVQAALERGAEPSEVVMSLLQNGIPPEGIVQIFAQLGASPEEAAGLVQQVMGQAQGGGQEQMMQEQPMAQLGQIVKGAKQLGRMANIGTLGTLNTLAKTAAPIMINPIHFPTFGMGLDPDIGIGPFTGSPLNVLPIGKKLEGDDSAFRKFGDTLDYVKLSRSLDPSHGALLRLGKSQIAGEGNWAAPSEVNEAYPGVFAAQFNTATPGSNLGYTGIPNRRGVLITDAQGNRMPKVSIDDPGLSFHRRLPFSNRYIDVNMDKLRNDEFDWRTMGGNAQGLLERFGYAAGLAGLAGGIGATEPQEHLEEHETDPKMNSTEGARNTKSEYTENPFNYRKQDGGQQIPMAMYGMSMGGYDMPFYDMSQAEYGMSMGSGMSQNYQGRPKRIPGGGPMFPLAKAQDGLNIDATNMTEDQLQRAIWDAQQKDKNAQITITRKDANGQVKTQKLKTSGFTVPKGEDITDLKGFPDTPAGRVAASQYMLIEQNLNNPTVRAEIIKNTKEALDNPDAWTGKSGTRNANNTWTKKYGSLPSDDEVIKQALNHQKRNLMFEANEVDPQLFTDVGNGLDSVDKVLAEKYINPKTGKEYTRAEATAELKNLKDDGYTSVAAMSDKLGVPLDPSGKDRVLQQGTMHGYAKAYQNFSSGGYDSNPDAKYAMDNFLGNVSLVHSGANDETSMGALYGSLGNKISPLDDKYDYANNNWYDFAHSSRGDSRFTTYGDTTAGHKYMVGKRNLEFEDIPEDPNCQCTDPSNTATYGKYKDADGNCSCTPPEDNPKKCPCQKSDGTVLEMTANADGTCPPCTEDKDIDVPGPAPEWWLQDTIKTTGAFGDLMGIKKHMPWAPGVDLETPRPTFLDPTRELAANAEQANIQTQGMAQFAGPQALSARSSGIQGQAAKNAADVLSKYNNANVNIANQFEMKGTDIRNQESMLKQATAQRLYDQNTVANQQFDNAKLAMRNNLRNYYTNAITNKEKTDALNQMYPNYAVSPAVGGRMNFVPTKKQVNGQGSSSMTMQEAMDWCKKNNPNATDHSACMDRVMNRQGRDSSKGSGANANAVNTMYPGQQMGGPVYEDGGFVHINSWLPFIL